MLRNQHHETMTASPLKPAQANDNRRFTHVSNHLELMASICYQSDNAFVTWRICALTRDHVPYMTDVINLGAFSPSFMDQITSHGLYLAAGLVMTTTVLIS